MDPDDPFRFCWRSAALGAVLAAAVTSGLFATVLLNTQAELTTAVDQLTQIEQTGAAAQPSPGTQSAGKGKPIPDRNGEGRDGDGTAQ